METKRCSKCKQEKSHAEFSRNQKSKDGLQSYCKLCTYFYERRWSATDRGRTLKRATQQRFSVSKKGRAVSRKYFATRKGLAAMCRYRETVKGIAAHLRSQHNIDVSTSEHWAKILKHPHTRCALCGLSNKLIKVYTKHGKHWILGHVRRLTFDHITPGVNDGHYRPLCSECNRTRGAAVMSDEEVLMIVGAKWRFAMAPRFLWWLNTKPGVGGRLHRNKRCETRDEKFVEGGKSAGIESDRTC